MPIGLRGCWKRRISTMAISAAAGFIWPHDDPSLRDLDEQAAQWRQDGIAVESLSPSAAGQLEPALADAAQSGLLRAAMLLPDEVQIRSPRFLHALLAACAARGVEITAGAEVDRFVCDQGRMRAVQTTHGEMIADQFCITTGCWSGLVAARLGVPIAIKPIRGQIVLLSLPGDVLQAGRLCRAALLRAARRWTNSHRLDSGRRRLPSPDDGGRDPQVARIWPGLDSRIGRGGISSAVGPACGRPAAMVCRISVGARAWKMPLSLPGIIAAD